jgi:hypothetical protein
MNNLALSILYYSMAFGAIAAVVIVIAVVTGKNQPTEGKSND